jgi:uncharacterized membrane protein YczE
MEFGIAVRIGAKRLLRWGVYALAVAIVWQLGMVQGWFNELEDKVYPQLASGTWILTSVGILLIAIGVAIRSYQLRRKAERSRSWASIKRATAGFGGQS